jgi:hypothetical protein
MIRRASSTEVIQTQPPQPTRSEECYDHHYDDDSIDFRKRFSATLQILTSYFASGALQDEDILLKPFQLLFTDYSSVSKQLSHAVFVCYDIVDGAKSLGMLNLQWVKQTKYRDAEENLTSANYLHAFSPANSPISKYKFAHFIPDLVEPAFMAYDHLVVAIHAPMKMREHFVVHAQGPNQKQTLAFRDNVFALPYLKDSQTGFGIANPILRPVNLLTHSSLLSITAVVESLHYHLSSRQLHISRSDLTYPLIDLDVFIPSFP